MDIEDLIQSKKVLLFDLDNTLCNHDEAVSLARREAYYHGERLGSLSNGGDLAARSALREKVKGILSEPPEPILFDQSGSAQSRETWIALLKPLGIEDPIAAMRAGATYERRRFEEMKPLPEIRKFLEIVKRSHRLYILADGNPAHQRRALRGMRLDEAVHGIFFEEELGLNRSDPALFRELLKLMKALPEETAFAGDNINTDIAGARAADLFAIWRKPESATRHPGDPTPDFELDSFLELFPRLERRIGER